MRFGPNGIDPEECDVCGEMKGATKGWISSSRRHGACFRALVEIQRIAASDKSNIDDILNITIMTVGDKR
jgi:hypothetical protein